MRERNLKRVEHRKRCRLCWAVAQLKRGDRYYCPTCYHWVFQKPTSDQTLVVLDTATLMAALAHNTITGRAAADILDRILKARTV